MVKIAFRMNMVLGSPQSKNQKAITGEMVKEICFPIKVDRLGNIIQVGSCILTN